MTLLSKVKYPVYVPTKGRWADCTTARLLQMEDVPFRLVVEPQEEENYKKYHNENNILTLPFSNLGSVTHARNWIKKHASESGHKRHWQFDDDIKGLQFWKQGKRIDATAEFVLTNCETFVDRYKNVAISGLKHSCFGYSIDSPFKKNRQVYTCVLVLNELPFWWRGKHGEDTDFSLQVLSNNWCTVLFEIFQFVTATSSSVKGGNTEMYDNDGRMERARELQRRWSPHVGKISRTSGRPNFNINGVWKKFDTPLLKANT